jgi:hypothetical protein
MPSSNYPCDEHRDLYLELLKKAEKEADKALAQIIMRKLYLEDAPPEVTKDGCQVFAFPGIPAAAACPTADHLFWKSDQFWQDLLQFMAFLSAGIGWFIFSLRLICNQIIN